MRLSPINDLRPKKRQPAFAHLGVNHGHASIEVLLAHCHAAAQWRLRIEPSQLGHGELVGGFRGDFEGRAAVEHHVGMILHAPGQRLRVVHTHAKQRVGNVVFLATHASHWVAKSQSKLVAQARGPADSEHGAAVFDKRLQGWCGISLSTTLAAAALAAAAFAAPKCAVDKNEDVEFLAQLGIA